MSKILQLIFMFALSLLLIQCNMQESPLQQDNNNAGLKLGPYFGMSPTNEAKLLAPELIASSLDEYNGTFDKEGTTFFFTTNTPASGIISYCVMMPDGTWSEARTAPFSGEYSEYDPLYSPDGRTLYFSSERPSPKDSLPGKTNIWKTNYQDGKWAEPRFVELSNRGDYFSSMTRSGSIYFNIWDDGDLYKAVPSAATGYSIEALPSNINSQNGEGDAFVSPDEDYLIFRGYNESLGAGDLYISFRDDSLWTDPMNLGAPINSAAHEMCPYVTSDGKFFIWASARMSKPFQPIAGQSVQNVRNQHASFNNGQLNIYYTSASFIDSLHSQLTAKPSMK